VGIEKKKTSTLLSHRYDQSSATGRIRVVGFQLAQLPAPTHPQYSSF